MTIHCYACDGLTNPQKDLDKQTGRLYCTECFEPTLEEQLKQDLKEVNSSPCGRITPILDDLLFLEDNTIIIPSLIFRDDNEDDDDL